MIVYYNPEDGSILGMSYVLDQSRNDSYFITDDPIAEKIFLGKEKSIRYCTIVKAGAERQGFIKLKESSSPTYTIKNRVVEILIGNSTADLSVIQDVSKKTVRVEIHPAVIAWWKTDPFYSKKKCVIVACKLKDPYIPYWSKMFSCTDAENEFAINYSGTDDITFYTTKLFDSYQHEIKSS
jgi:hypothetical protein